MRAASFALAILLIGIVCSTGLARAADTSKEEAKQHFLKGQQLFDVGRWDEAASEFEQAYALRSDPVFIYNMAQACRRKGDADSTNYCHAVSPGASISLGSFSTTCYDTANPGTALAATDVPNIDKISVQVPSTSTAITVSKLCLTGITFAK
jgi:hypothetical protein